MTNLISKALIGLLLLASLGVNAQQYANITYIHTEADGTVFAATDEDGNLEWKLDHTPFGNEIRNTATGRNNDLSYTGKPFDEEIGLSYYGARWYDPITGRFTGIDPAPVDPNDFRRFNRYAYGFNSPYRYNDPDGRLPVDYAVDGISVSISAALFANDPSLANGLGLAADTILAVVPYVPAGVGLIRGGDKALDTATATKGLVFNASSKQLGKKLGKHVSDFGGNPANAADRARVLDRINDIGQNPDKIVQGTFSGLGGPRARGAAEFRIKGNDVVVTRPNGNFVTILKDGVLNNTSVKNALGGG